ncbi:MAG: 50S ribosomal protein L6 [Planctomycetota bacterium]
MSRIGKQPIPLPAGTTVTVNGSDITVSGKNGTLTQTLRPEIAVELVDDGKTVNVNRVNESRSAKALQHLVDEVLDFSKIEADELVLDPHRFAPAELARELVQVMAPKAAERRTELRTEVRSP